MAIPVGYSLLSLKFLSAANKTGMVAMLLLKRPLSCGGSKLK